MIRETSSEASSHDATFWRQRSIRLPHDDDVLKNMDLVKKLLNFDSDLLDLKEYMKIPDWITEEMDGNASNPFTTVCPHVVAPVNDVSTDAPPAPVDAPPAPIDVVPPAPIDVAPPAPIDAPPAPIDAPPAPVDSPPAPVDAPPAVAPLAPVDEPSTPVAPSAPVVSSETSSAQRKRNTTFSPCGLMPKKYRLAEDKDDEVGYSSSSHAGSSSPSQPDDDDEPLLTFAQQTPRAAENTTEEFDQTLEVANPPCKLNSFVYVVGGNFRNWFLCRGRVTGFTPKGKSCFIKYPRDKKVYLVENEHLCFGKVPKEVHDKLMIEFDLVKKEKKKD